MIGLLAATLGECGGVLSNGGAEAYRIDVRDVAQLESGGAVAIIASSSVCAYFYNTS